MAERCGCRPGEAGEGGYIEFCPLHAAAAGQSWDAQMSVPRSADGDRYNGQLFEKFESARQRRDEFAEGSERNQRSYSPISVTCIGTNHGTMVEPIGTLPMLVGRFRCGLV